MPKSHRCGQAEILDGEQLDAIMDMLKPECRAVDVQVHSGPDQRGAQSEMGEHHPDRRRDSQGMHKKENGHQDHPDAPETLARI